jgi:anti-anti-sigma regulatory factor
MHGSRMGPFMLRIERSANAQVVFTLSGRIQTEDIQHFQQLLVVETSGQQLIFDLRDVTLINQDAVTFLAHCEVDGIRLENCPLHIRNWIDQEKHRNRRRRMQKNNTK